LFGKGNSPGEIFPRGEMSWGNVLQSIKRAGRGMLCFARFMGAISNSRITFSVWSLPCQTSSNFVQKYKLRTDRETLRQRNSSYSPRSKPIIVAVAAHVVLCVEWSVVLKQSEYDAGVVVSYGSV